MDIAAINMLCVYATDSLQRQDVAINVAMQIYKQPLQKLCRYSTDEVLCHSRHMKPAQIYTHTHTRLTALCPGLPR